MKRLCAALALMLAAASADAQLGCVDELYDALTGTSKRTVATPDLSVVLKVDPERADPLWLDDPDRRPTASFP
jgi:hypothetical protein